MYDVDQIGVIFVDSQMVIDIGETRLSWIETGDSFDFPKIVVLKQMSNLSAHVGTKAVTNEVQFVPRFSLVTIGRL